MTNPHFEQSLPEWSARKHAILADYLPAFCRALSGRGNTIWYVDGYAGAGVYQDPSKDDSTIQYGSPVLAARTAQLLPYDVRCVNVESDKTHFATLQETTRDFDQTKIRNILGDFKQVVGDVLELVSGSPALFFLDSFGTKDLPMAGLVDQIASRRQPTDILLRYGTEAVRRLAGYADRESDEHNKKINAGHLDNWFRGSGWRDIVRSSPASARDEALLDYYKQQLISISGGRIEFVQSYPIRTINGITKYHIVFATGDRLGLKIMSEILYKENEAYLQDQESDRLKRSGQGSLNLFGDESSNALETLKSEIISIGQGQETWKFLELYYKLITTRGWFAQMSEKEFRKACKELHTEGRIIRLTEDKAWAKETGFRIKARPNSE